jgi:hypothetical protein
MSSSQDNQDSIVNLKNGNIYPVGNGYFIRRDDNIAEFFRTDSAFKGYMDLFDYCETLLTTYCGLYSGDKQMVVIQNIICVINYLIEYLEPEVYTIYNDIEKTQ